jgi:hypothetical protein
LKVPGVNADVKVGANLLSFLEQPSNQIIIKLEQYLGGVGGCKEFKGLVIKTF